MTDMHEPSESPPAAIPVGIPEARPLSASPSPDATAQPSAGAPPEVLGYAGLDGVRTAAWRRGKQVVLLKNAALPFRCVKCNSPAEGKPLRRNFSWHHPAIYLTIFIGLLGYVIVALCVRKTARISFGLCPRHRAQRAWGVAMSWLFILGCFGLVACAALFDNLAFTGLGLLSLILGLAIYLVAAQPLTPSRIDDQWVWLRGAGKDYLDSLPPGS